MNKVAKFYKVSSEQFKKNCEIDCFDKIKLPKRATSGSAGYDFYSPFNFDLKPNESIIIPTGIRCKIDDGWFLAIFPRSGFGFKFRVMLSNTVGIIDSDYFGADNEGHIMIKIINASKDDKTVSLKCGDAFAQGIFIPYGITIDDEANEKRTGGFGSTNK